MQAFAEEVGKSAPDPSILIAGAQEILEKQLGLRAELRKVRADVLVIDHAENVPTGN
jgi:uncharacterized protein (TIGR03435 family)